MNIAMVDSFMSVFGFTRVSPTDEELEMRVSQEERNFVEAEEAQESKDELRRQETGNNKPMPSPKYRVDDNVYYGHTWRVVTNVTWVDDHYEYEVFPWDSHVITEEDLN